MIPSPAVTFSQAGTYTVTLYSQKGACLNITQKIIHVELPSELTIPNVFTPNGDGINDVFFVKIKSMSEINVFIVDRWGHKVYELANSDNGNVLWDGKNQAGKEVPEGTYFYVIKASGKDGQTFNKNGTINLFR
jgi:gliding motility-associated-like protein